MRVTTIRFCPNQQCPAHGHAIYTQGTRCGFCRWDLKLARNRSETVIEKKPFRRAGMVPAAAR